MNAATLSIDIKKGGGPGLGVAVFFRPRTQSNPGGPWPPCFINVGSGDAVSADFHKEKIGKFSRGPGAKPPASHGRSPRLGVLSPRGERTWPRNRCPFSRDYIFMRGQTRIPVFFRSGLRATFFLHTKKEGKDVPRGNPLEPRVILIFRAIVGHHNNGEADTRTGPYHKVPQGFEPS